MIAAIRMSIALAVCLLAGGQRPAGAADADIESLEQRAFRAAVDRVAPSVVRIETVGGLQRVDKVLFGDGPTTGLVVDKDGYIVSSAFNFINRPASILVRLAGGKLKPAELVATDHSRMLVLLKVKVDEPLPVPEIAPRSEIRVGQWAIAVGRTFEGNRTNMSVGVVSALGRIWGKAVQTDAIASPGNYGGPLVDVRGRVLGVIVPLSPSSAKEVAGYEWYDSGIGFAADAEHIMQILPKLRKGDDLFPGVIGISLQGSNPSIGEPVITACHPNSPAAKAGLKKGDRIVEIEGQETLRASHVKRALSSRYAGDKVRVVVLRDEKRIESEIELIAKLQPYQHPFLGVLPIRRTASLAAGGTA
ncbi:MAG: trypsin-like peptidase domain-containing protein, partial [Candidatus Nealsonbacteria bacterium]|nr:trypsin-like peptidase domain-containing protein [Candidatus Nealsonbacteria bacterium]